MALTYMTARPGMCLKFKNGIKTDTCLGNLEWITKTDLGKKTGANSRRQPVIKIDQSGEVVGFYPSARDAARKNFMSYQTVMDRCNGKCKSKFAPDGYRYEWEDEKMG